MENLVEIRSILIKLQQFKIKFFVCIKTAPWGIMYGIQYYIKVNRVTELNPSKSTKHIWCTELQASNLFKTWRGNIYDYFIFSIKKKRKPMELKIHSSQFSIFIKILYKWNAFKLDESQNQIQNSSRWDICVKFNLHLSTSFSLYQFYHNQFTFCVDRPWFIMWAKLGPLYVLI